MTPFPKPAIALMRVLLGFLGVALVVTLLLLGQSLHGREKAADAASLDRASMQRKLDIILTRLPVTPRSQ